MEASWLHVFDVRRLHSAGTIMTCAYPKLLGKTGGLSAKVTHRIVFVDRSENVVHCL